MLPRPTAGTKWSGVSRRDHGGSEEADECAEVRTNWDRCFLAGGEMRGRREGSRGILNIGYGRFGPQMAAVITVVVEGMKGKPMNVKLGIRNGIKRVGAVSV